MTSEQYRVMRRFPNFPATIQYASPEFALAHAELDRLLVEALEKGFKVEDYPDKPNTYYVEEDHRRYALWVETIGIDTPAPDAVPAETAYANDTLEQVDAELRMVGIEPFHWQQLKAELARRQAEVINLNQTLDLYREAVRQIDMRMRFVRDPLKRWEPEVEMIDFGTWLCNTKRDYQFTQDLKRLIDKINLAKGLNALDSNTEARPAP